MKTLLSAKLSGAVPVLCETVYEGFLNVMAEYDTGPGKGFIITPNPRDTIRIHYTLVGQTDLGATSMLGTVYVSDNL